MEFYDVHTHDTPPSTEEGEQSHPYILNVYPLGFEDAKDSLSGCYFSCGVHPWYSENADPQLKFLSEIANDSRIIAIGEAGYDRLKGPSEVVQSHVFERQVELSEELRKPLIIHCVKAWSELLSTHKKYKPKQPWIIHSYRGKPELTEQLLDHGFMFSISDKFNRDSVRLIPLDQIFCETDEADTNIRSVYENLAEALEASLEDLADSIEKNILEIFPELIHINASVIK